MLSEATGQAGPHRSPLSVPKFVIVAEELVATKGDELVPVDDVGQRVYVKMPSVRAKLFGPLRDLSCQRASRPRTTAHRGEALKWGCRLDRKGIRTDINERADDGVRVRTDSVRLPDTAYAHRRYDCGRFGAIRLNSVVPEAASGQAAHVKAGRADERQTHC